MIVPLRVFYVDFVFEQEANPKMAEYETGYRHFGAMKGASPCVRKLFDDGGKICPRKRYSESLIFGKYLITA
jgi:hypothetical protein